MDEIYYDHSCKCPICEIEYKTKKIRDEKVHVNTIDTDFCKYYEGPNPYFYQISVCPNCGYSFDESFKFKLDQEATDHFVNVFAPRWNKRDFSGERNINQAIETYKLALLCGEISKIKDSYLAGICLKLCYLYRMIGDKEEEEKFIKGTINFLTQAYEKEKMDKDGEMKAETAVYLLGELSYRVGMFEETKKWFNLGLSKYVKKPDVIKIVAEKIRDRWQEIKDEVMKQS